MRFVILCFVVFWLVNDSMQKESTTTGQLTGKVFAINDQPPSSFSLSQTVVVAIKNFYNASSGEPDELTYDQIYRFQTYEYVYGSVNPSDGDFVVEGLDTAATSFYSLFLFVDENNDTKWTPDSLEACGWNLLPDVSPKPIPTRTLDGIVWNISLNSGLKYTEEDVRTVPNGVFDFVQGYPVVHTWGTPTERAYAHGLLLAKQIVQVFRFWILESTVRDYDYYDNAVIPFLKVGIVFPEQAQEEMESAYEGMIASGTNLFVPELNRNFSHLDLVYINNYGVQPPPLSFISRRSSSHCSQFSSWGERTNGVGTIAARNMDDELDIRKTTISMFLVMAVEPQDHRRRSGPRDGGNCTSDLAYINFGWPGFISAMTSGFNEAGIHAMLNSGFDWQPGPPPKSPKVGMLLNNVLDIMKCQTIGEAAGGVLPFAEERVPKFVVGVNILLAQPDDIHDGTAPSVVYEGDRLGGLYRYEMDASPYLSEFLLTTNHFMKYGYTLDEPFSNFGEPVGMSSWWRYLAGKNYLYALDSFHATVTGNEMERALQNVCHGTSEHSVVTFSNQKKFKVAVGSLEYSQDYAPYNLPNAPLLDFWEVFIGDTS